MRESFIEKRFSPNRLRLITQSNEIVLTYQAQGYRLTLRQLFYQMVSRTLLPNTERSYKMLGDAVSDGRLAGIIDWASIEDRVRVPRRPPEFQGLPDLVEVALQSYRLPRWDGQKHYVELWVEKDALAGVLAPLSSQYHVTMVVNRGYSSQSAMYESSKRFLEAEKAGKSPVLLYLGDHDPSGEDMVRDIRDRMVRFGCVIDVRKIALTMGQVTHYNPPPTPAKLSDSRSGSYIAKHGASSWEVDALPPDTLQAIISSQIEKYVDLREMEKVKIREGKDKKRLAQEVKSLGA